MDAASRPVRVLVVEDDEEIAQVLQRSLRLEGYEVKLAADGVRALDEAHAFLPDIIVLDLGLPRLDGIDVAKRLRDDGDDTPILILTARDALESRVEGLDVGADDYLVKPFERQELLARLRALLRRRPPRGMAPLRVGDLTLNPDTHEVSRDEPPDRSHPARVRAARVPDAQRAPRDLAPEAARRSVGLRPVLDHEHHRGVRVQPQKEA